MVAKHYLYITTAFISIFVITLHRSPTNNEQTIEKIMRNRFVSLLLLTLCLIGAKAQISNGIIIKGFVKDNTGQGIAGVIVNNGRDFVVTDKNGQWSLTTDTLKSNFISISTPRDFHLPAKDGLAQSFYISTSDAVKTDENTFVLTRRTERVDTFHYIAISDPQIRNAHDMRRWQTETVPDIMQTADSLIHTGEVVTMTLGDLVFDNMKLFAQYKASLKNPGKTTVFQCIGNHDFDKKYADLEHSAKGTGEYAEQTYCRHFGPTNYSFNIGKAHIVTMKSINYAGNYKYEEEISPADIQWLKDDLSFVPDSIVVILNMHAPAWNRMERIDNIKNAQELTEILSSHNAHVFCGHTHFFENVEVTPKLYQHNIAAACGAWWTSNLNRCGAPNGYMIVDVNDTDLKWSYKGTRRDRDFQMRVYRPGKFRTQPKYVIANVWDWDPHCRVVWYQDGKYMGRMQQVTDDDEMFIRTKPLKQQTAKTQHLFRAFPTNKYNTIKVVFTDRFGRSFSQTITGKTDRPAITDFKLPHR